MTDPVAYFHGGHVLAPDLTEVGIRGKRGRFRFLHATESATGAVSLTLLTLSGARRGHFISVRPEQIKKVFGPAGDCSLGRPT